MHFASHLYEDLTNNYIKEMRGSRTQTGRESTVDNPALQ